MNIKPIRTEDDYAAAMARLDELWGAEVGTPKVMSWKCWRAVDRE
ncbi:hypothetical protein [Phytopseudomonas dryadis]|nr:hypothetical protein [Pseudomonas dryadis]